MSEVAESPRKIEVEEKPPMIFLELVDQGSSGFIQDGTHRSNTPVELRAPGIRFIPNEGMRRGVKTENGKTVRFNERIRYIRNEEVIILSEQKRLGIEPNPLPREDKIPIEKGYATIVREGASVGLYDYITQAYYNVSNPDRSDKATGLYRILEIDKQTEMDNEDELISADAVKYVGSLYQKVGKNSYQYSEDKIAAVCELLSIYAETNATKIQALMSLAKQRPTWFLDKVVKLENTTVTEVTHALELNVIRFNVNVAEYCNKDRVIKSLGTKQLTQDQKITRLADWLRTAEGHAAYMELKSEIEGAQSDSLK